jgi:hypothetical protein
MSLDISKLENARERSGKVIARCPACAEAGHDKKGEHLFICEDRRFGCVIYPGDGSEAKEHRRRISTLCGDRTIKPLVVHQTPQPSALRTSRTPVQESRAHFCNKGAGLLGRLGRLFTDHTPVSVQSELSKSPCQKTIYDSAAVPGVPTRDASDASQRVIESFPTSLLLNRKLTEHELSILRRAGAENDPIILDAINLFNATVVNCSQKPFTRAEPDPEIETPPDEVQVELNL